MVNVQFDEKTALGIRMGIQMGIQKQVKFML